MPGPLAIDAGRLQARLDRLPDWFRAGEYRLDTVARLAAFFWLDEAAMTRLIGSETRINTDGRHYFDSQAALIPAPPELQLPYFQADAASCFTSLTDGQRQAIADEQLVAFHMGHFAYFHRNRALYRAWCLDQANANTLYWVDLALGGGKPDPKVLCTSD
jgi:spermidine synthase